MRTTTTRKKKRKERLILPGMLILSILAVSIFIGSEAFASAIQNKITQYGGDGDKAASVIFAASCATCHGADGMGGVTWIKNSPTDKRIAPKIAGKSAKNVKKMVRRGSNNGAMPGFGEKEITTDELAALGAWLHKGGADGIKSNGVEAPTPPSGLINEVKLNILDATPWFLDESVVPSSRVELLANEYVKVVNTGRTWHTFTNGGLGGPNNNKDSGFIGYAGNYKDAVGDLGDIGYYYAGQGPTGVTSGLATGCIKYYCKLHPYMATEVCTSGNSPKGPSDLDTGAVGGESIIGLTRAHKHKSPDPAIAGVGEVWVSAQSQEDSTEDTTTVDANKNVGGWNDILGGKGASGKDGAYQVINASDWSVDYIANVGNNPHNSWPGKDKNGKGKDVVLSADWHDNNVVLMDANTKAVLGKKRAGGANAHVQVTPGKAEQFYVTIMGGVGIQRINVDKLQVGLAPGANVGSPIRGDFTPHGLWFCDDARHILTANTLSNSATLYDIKTKKSVSVGSGLGEAAPLAPSIMSGYEGGCERGFTNNAISAAVSIYDLGLGSPDSIARLGGADWGPVNDPGGSDIDTDDNGTINLRNTVNNQVGLGLGSFVARWANLPIQTPVSPKDATSHGRFMVTANKASFNVSITGLDSATGLPWGLFTIPAGLGAHGVTYGLKSNCDWDDTGSETDDDPDPLGTKCYYAYVTNTFDDFVSVYDLEKIDVNDDLIDNNPEINASPGGDNDGICEALEDCVGMEIAGSAIVSEQVYVEGGAVVAVATLDPRVAGLCDVVDLLPAGGDVLCNDAISDGDDDGFVNDGCPVVVVTGETGAACRNAIDDDGDTYVNDGCPVVTGLVYDIPCGTGPSNCGDPGLDGEAAVADYNLVLATGTDVSADVLHCGVGAMNPAARTTVINLILAGTVADGYSVVSSLAVGHSLYVADLPIGVVCPDCRAGVHAGDIPLNLTVSGDDPLAGTSSSVLSLTLGADPDGESSDYVYYKTEVYVDTETTACALQALSGLSVGAINNCNATVDGPDVAGRLNGAFETDLQLGINTGGQGIVTRIPGAGHGGNPWP